MRQLFLLFLIVNFSILSFSQSNEVKILNIDKKYQKIEKSINQKKVRKQYFEYKCPNGNEHGTVWFIFKKDDLVKIEINSIIDDEDSQKTGYYFTDDQLIFVYNEAVSPQTTDSGKVIYHYTEKGIYFESENAFYCSEKNFNLNPGDLKKVISDNTPEDEIDCDDIEFFKEHLSVVQQLKNNKDEITLCIW
jgi:hypothetical protein